MTIQRTVELPIRAVTIMRVKLVFQNSSSVRPIPEPESSSRHDNTLSG